MLHHDQRAVLVYSCQKCLHEWQLDPADEPAPAYQADETASGLNIIGPGAEATRQEHEEALRSTDSSVLPR